VDVGPNDLQANLSLGQEYAFGRNEIIKGLLFFQKAHDLKENWESLVLMSIGYSYFCIGEYSKALKYIY
jgi:hypothetical protein